MVGASLAAVSTVLWGGVLDKIVIPMVLSPVLGLILGYLVMATILWLFRHQHPGRTTRGFRYAQTLSAAAMALGHGLQDAGKTMGIIVLALTVGGYQDDSSIPLWVKISTALIISAGTYSGGWRIMRTLGRKIIHLDPPQGFAAETSGAAILYIAGLGFGAPISTTHTIPRRSWVSAPPSGCLPFDGEWPGTSSPAGSSRSPVPGWWLPWPTR